MVDGPKATLRRYLQNARGALLWKLEGLSEHDARRPLTPTGTNVLGLVKHLSGVELVYFGDTFGRPSGEPLPWEARFADDPNADMWATPDETRAEIVDRYKRAWAYADATFDALPLDAPGRVPHWPAGEDEVTLHQILVHVVAETHRHAGHADIVRELIDERAGMREGNDNLPAAGAVDWAAHRARVERAAREAGGSAGARRRHGVV
ncbi:DinB family protein [Actinomadura parmotrematis]|uniref:DinB family protein n=1 Tax=Actinomadura parmotrematis TaxID=2864039 RepID=A0ABS7G6H1_9ACTN|nr:DinB family protein [Actinomadura parmotrematis]MBW8487407.1 DinB family protein [Actinomadura parmotrematis]